MAASKYDIEVDLANRQGTSHAFLVEMVGANKRVLDVGCDTGYLGEALAAFGNDTAGFEINDETARKARTRIPRVEVGDLESSDLVETFGRGSFDVVVFGDVLEHLREPLSVLRRARPLLGPGGCVLISTPNVAHGDVRLALLKGQWNYGKLGILDETHTRFFTRDSLVSFLHDAGFVLVELRRTRAALFSTEIGVSERDFDPALVETLRADPEATTYQFVVRAVPDDAAAITSEQALRLDESVGRVASLTAELAVVRDTAARSSNERDALVASAAQLQQDLERSIGHAAELRAERDAVVAELAAVNDTRTMRATRRARSAYSLLRRR